MTQRDGREWLEVRNQGINENDANKVLDTLLALDRLVVEMSLRTYKIPRRDRLMVRKQNQRLHDSVREQLAQWLDPSRTS